MPESSPVGDMRKFFFDVSGVVEYVIKNDRYSGIQRVVVTLIVQLADLLDPEFLYLSWYEKASGKYFCLKFSEIGKDAFATPSSMRFAFHGSLTSSDHLPILQKYRTKPAKYYARRTLLDLAASLGREEYFRRYDMTSKSWRQMRRTKPKTTRLTLNTQLFEDIASAKDHLILLDGAWRPDQIRVFQKARDAGLQAHSLVYDLIPILTPMTCDGTAPGTFYDWLLSSTKYTDRYITISQSAREDLQVFLKAHQVQIPVTAVPLAQAPLPAGPEYHTSQHHEGPLSAKISVETYPFLKEVLTLDPELRYLVGGSYVLVVGTIEARKNVWRIAMAWKTLLDKGHTDLPRLVFAGRPGWLRKDFQALLDITGNLYGYIRVIEGPSDEVLRLLYKHCSFTIMASTYEGWGLPVGEALAYGKTAVVADNSSLPEVGGDLVEYCDAHSVESIAGAVKRVLDPERRAQLEARIATVDLRSWTDVTKDLLTALRAKDS